MISLAINELDRICSLEAYDLIGPVVEPVLDDIAALAAKVFDTPHGAVTIVGLDDAWVYRGTGARAARVRREHAICAQTILKDEVLVIGDLAADPRSCGVPDVAGAPNLRFYAGAPIATADGCNLGTVCVADTMPRTHVTAAEKLALVGLARIASSALDQRRRRSIAEAKARTRESFENRALRLSEITLFHADAQGRLISLDTYSPALARSAQMRRGVATWINHIHPADVGGLLQIWRTAVSCASPFFAEFRVRDARGGWRWFQARARQDRTGSGASDWIGTLQDVDQHRRDVDRIAKLEAELSHLSRVTAMGTMASTLAHELNQPLAAISGYVRAGRRMLKASAVDVSQLAEAMDGAVDATMRAGCIIKSMRELVAHGDLERRSVELQPLVREAFRIATSDLDLAGLETGFDFEPMATTALIDPLQIQQVIINLVRNAVQAVNRRMKSRISIGVRRFGQDQCEIAVSDNGPGLDPAIAERLFTPFNSTKADGMGIGLAISRTIVEAHGGGIFAEPGDEGGTTFRFTVPTC